MSLLVRLSVAIVPVQCRSIVGVQCRSVVGVRCRAIVGVSCRSIAGVPCRYCRGSVLLCLGFYRAVVGVKVATVGATDEVVLQLLFS